MIVCKSGCAIDANKTSLSLNASSIVSFMNYMNFCNKRDVILSFRSIAADCRILIRLRMSGEKNDFRFSSIGLSIDQRAFR